MAECAHPQQDVGGQVVVRPLVRRGLQVQRAGRGDTSISRNRYLRRRYYLLFELYRIADIEIVVPVEQEPEADAEHPEAHQPQDEVDCEHQELEEGEASALGGHPGSCGWLACCGSYL